MTAVLKQLHFGNDLGKGTAPTSTASGWISYTFVRPQARIAQNGERVFIAKGVRMKVAAKGVSRKMYARLSWPGGAPFSNTLSTTVKWRPQARSSPLFMGASLPMTSASGGPNMRVWLVCGGPFYFDRNVNAVGHVVSATGQTFPGAPVGYMEYAEVPGPPRDLFVSREEDDPTKATVSWAFPVDFGGVPLSGYLLQYSDNAEFTTGVHEFQVNRMTVLISGLSPTKSYSFRVTARNEVSNHFKLTGGDWSATTLLGVDSSPKPPVDDFGGTTLPLNYFPDNAVATPGPLFATMPILQRMQDVIRSPDTGEWYISQSRDGGAAGDLGSATMEDTVISRVSASGTVLDSMTLVDAGHGTTVALRYKSGTVYLIIMYESAGTIGARNDLLQIRYQAGTFTRDTVPSPEILPKFTLIDSDAQFDWLNDQVAFRISNSGTSETYELRRISEYFKGIDQVYARIQVAVGPPALQGFFTYQRSLFLWLGTGNSPIDDPPRLVQYSWENGQIVGTFDASDVGNVSGAYPGNWYEPEGASLYNVDNKNPVAYIGYTFNPYGAHTYQAFSIPLLTEAAAEAKAGVTGSTDPGGTTGSDPGTDPGGTPSPTPPPAPPPVVYSPVPDTSSTETNKGGLLLSRQPRDTQQTVFIMDRGGTKRLGQLSGFIRLTWHRHRSDISTAEVVLTPRQVADSEATLRRAATARSELVIFRGDQRVWEGPITSIRYARSGLTISATDVLWYASRTIPHANYSFAYPNLGYSVEFAAGVMLAEMGRKESLDPPINVLPFLRTYVEDGDAKTSKVLQAGSTTVWQMLDDMASNNGINYTVVGRAIHIWDASRAALGRIRTLTEQDFLGDPYITEYGTDMASLFTVSDGQGGFATAGAIDQFYGEVELLAQAYGETSQQVLDPTTGNVIGTTITQAQLLSQAERNLSGRNPVPVILNIPDNSSLDVGRNGIGLDVLVPGVYIPVQATLSGRTMSQVQKLNTVTVHEDSSGQTVTLSMIPASIPPDPTGGDATA